MKKILIFLLINCSLLLGKNWEIENSKDKFGDLTKKITMFKESTDKQNIIQIIKMLDSFYVVKVSSSEYIGKKETNIFIKVDSNEPLTEVAKSYLGSNNIVYFAMNYEMMEQMETGKTLKIAIEKFDGGINTLRFNLNNYNTAIKKLHK